MDTQQKKVFSLIQRLNTIKNEKVFYIILFK